MNIEEIKDKLRKFANDRDWEQFHTHKNLAMAISGEVDETLKDSIYWKYNNKLINQRIDGQYPNKEYLEMKYDN